jgi:hypothetical protein
VGLVKAAETFLAAAAAVLEASAQPEVEHQTVALVSKHLSLGQQLITQAAVVEQSA